MLGWLARLLRIVFGLRVAYAPDLDDAELLRTECLVVTRDEEVFRARRGPALLLRTDDHVKWIAAFLSMGLPPFVKTACPICGGELVEIDCGEAMSCTARNVGVVSPVAGSIGWAPTGAA